MKKLYLIAVLSLCLYGVIIAQPGKNGAMTITGNSVIVNSYSELLSTASAGSSSINTSIASLNNGTPLSQGDLLLIISMQGADINTSDSGSYGEILDYNSVGLYEFAWVGCNSTGATINLSSPLVNTYQVGGRNRVQVVRVPLYTTLSIPLGNRVTAPAWNGATGGILAIHTLDELTNNGLIDVNGKGYRGGIIENASMQVFGPVEFLSTSVERAANKGESIAGNTNDYNNMGGSKGRGAPANGGGGGTGHNSGGGGGANGNNAVTWNGRGNPDLSGGSNWVSAWNLRSSNFSNNTSSGGGSGGYSWGAYGNPTIDPPGGASWCCDSWRDVGGWGGRPLNSNANSRIFFGGGGGAGQENDGQGISGANGGGIVFLISPNIVGDGVISANGNDAIDGVNAYDGLGGGGGGGSLIIKSNIASTITLNANGGNGSSSTGPARNTAIGPGGGGGGGFIAILNGSPVMNVNGGANGSELASNSTVLFRPDGATKGGAGALSNVDSSFPSYTNSALNLGIVSSASTICNGASVTITASGGNTYSWSSGESSSTVTVSPSISTTYTVTAANVSGCTGSALVTISVVSNIAVISGSNLLCSGATSTLSVQGNGSYLWSNGVNTASNTITTNGLYSVTVTDLNGCTASAQINITTSPSLNSVLYVDSINCNGGNDGDIYVNILTGTAPYSYNWSNSTASDSTLQNIAAGVYTVTVTDAAGCTSSLSATLTNPPLFAIQVTPSDTSVYFGGEAILIATGSLPATYQWQNDNTLSSLNSQTVIASPIIATTYAVTATSALGCTASASANVHLEGECIVKMPTAFTPNNDNYNDKFGILTSTSYTILDEFSIYNRWGERLFITNSLSSFWDGKVEGKDCAADVYVYTLRYHCPSDNKEIKLSGDFTLIR